MPCTSSAQNPFRSSCASTVGGSMPGMGVSNVSSVADSSHGTPSHWRTSGGQSRRVLLVGSMSARVPLRNRTMNMVVTGGRLQMGSGAKKLLHRGVSSLGALPANAIFTRPRWTFCFQGNWPTAQIPVIYHVMLKQHKKVIAAFRGRPRLVCSVATPYPSSHCLV